MVDVLVRRRSRTVIEMLAGSVRSALGLEQHERVHMLGVIETALYELIPDYLFRICPDNLMGGNLGSTDLRDPIISVSDTTYMGLRDGVPRARWTAAHELGHLVLHSGSPVHYARREYVSPEEDPEWQADQFAAAFLMPEQEMRKCATVEQAQERFGVGFRAARKRAREIHHKFRVTPKRKMRRVDMRRSS